MKASRRHALIQSFGAIEKLSKFNWLLLAIFIAPKLGDGMSFYLLVGTQFVLCILCELAGVFKKRLDAGWPVN